MVPISWLPPSPKSYSSAFLQGQNPSIRINLERETLADIVQIYWTFDDFFFFFLVPLIGIFCCLNNVDTIFKMSPPLYIRN